jgi:hypothetical protein
MFEWITEDQAVALPGMGEARFRRLVREGWLRPFFSVEGHEGEGVYRKDFVLMRRDEDWRAHPGARPAVVAKAYRGVPEVITDRNSVRSVVVKVVPPAAAGVLSPRVRARLEELLEKAERMLAGWR